MAPNFEWTIDVGDILVGVIGMIFIPVTKMLVSTLWAVRDAVRELTLLVMGNDKDPSSGLLGEVAFLKRESRRHDQILERIHRGPA